ncbi:MAG TPA: glycosyltransferase, partial [Polyangia bacterium]|nr:glycosyltransferase [Polyangia bacterium]
RYEATVFARQWRNAERFPGHRVVAVERIPDGRRRLASAWYALTGRSVILERAMAEGRFDVVHAHFGHNGIYAMGPARRLGLPLVVSLHGRDVSVLAGSDKYRPSWWHYLVRYRRLFREASLFLAASQDLKDLFVAAGCPAEKVEVFRLGIDLEAFRPGDGGEPGGEPTVLMIGRFVEKKGHVFGIRAAARARAAGARLRLVIVGEGPLGGEYRSLARTLGIEDMLELPGALPHVEVKRLLQGAAVLLAPSCVAGNRDRDSGLIVAKEASACGVPVIGTVHGGIPDIVEHGRTGFLVPERDDGAIAGHLASLLGDLEQQRAMGRAGREKMEREYDIRERVRALESVYDRVRGLSGRPGGGT